jgi:hypothetical protein
MSNKDASEARFEALSAPERERALQARKTYCSFCEEFEMKPCSWESFPSYQDYVDGSITESELLGGANEEFKDFTPTFGKYLVVEKEEPVASSMDDEKRERARAANKVYKKVCSESGIVQCFFSNFAAWSDYVQGKIDELEFSEKARLEVEEMKASANVDS